MRNLSQGCAELPALDAEASDLLRYCAPCRGWADRFWSTLFDKCVAEDDNACGSGIETQLVTSCIYNFVGADAGHVMV